MIRALFIIAIVILAAAYFGQNSEPTGSSSVVASTPAENRQAERIRELRDEAVQNIGWVAGNAHGHPIWPQVKPHVGKEGGYYNFIMRLAPAGSDHETEAMLNVALYNKWFERGQQIPFNETEATSRIKRVLDIIEELSTIIGD